MSFSDMMQSGRGPGVIGMLLGLMVLLGFGVLFMFAFDEGLQGSDQTIESVLKQQERDIRSLKLNIAGANEALAVAGPRQEKAKALRELQRENLFRKEQVVALKTDIGAAQAKLDELAAAFEAYKDEYRAFARSKAKGETLPRLETLRGDVYEGVTIREVTAVGIQILHEGGQKRIPFEDLPADMQDHYQFDPDQKSAALAREAEIRARHEQAVAVSDAAMDQRAAEQRAKAEQEARENTVRAIAAGKARISLLKENIVSQREAIVLEGRKTLSQAPQMRVKLANMERELANLVREVARLEASTP